MGQVGAKLGQVGAKLGLKTEKIDLEGIHKKHRLERRFVIDFGGSWTSFCRSFGIHVGPKLRFLLQFG